MPDRPYTLLSCGMSIDVYLGSAAPRRLELSNDADFDRVDAVLVDEGLTREEVRAARGSGATEPTEVAARLKEITVDPKTVVLADNPPKP